MRFWDRKIEIRYLRAYLRNLPNAILFVYGPKSSGKSTLIKEVIKRLKGDINVVFYDFRGKLLKAYRNFSDLLFSGSLYEGKASVKLFDIDEKVRIDLVESRVNPFELLEERLRKCRGKSIIVIDEIQKLKGLYFYDSIGNGKVLEELLNFFVRITKVEHLSHVILITSDTFFIEELCSKSFLANCAEYFLVDFFSDEIAKDILLSEKLSETESSYVVSWCGGVPWFLERVLSKRKFLGVRDAVRALYSAVKGEVLQKLGRLWSGSEDIAKKDGEVLVKILTNGRVDMLLKDRDSVERLASSEVVFYDPISGVVRPQTRLHDRAIREVLGLY